MTAGVMAHIIVIGGFIVRISGSGGPVWTRSLLTSARILTRHFGQKEGTRSIARTRTLAALRSVDAERVTALFNFIRDARLEKVVSLARGDLRKVNWKEANLYRANLSSHVFLREANLSEAYLGRANLSEAFLDAADLSKADFSRANLSWLDLARANLRGAKSLSDSQLALVAKLRHATMPDGTRYDGRFNLPWDIDVARTGDLDIDDPKAMAGFYEVSIEAYLRGQEWARKNLKKVREAGQQLRKVWGFEDVDTTTTLIPYQGTQYLIGDVGDLVAMEVLEAGAGADLINTLQDALEEIEHLQKFIEQVNELIEEGDLPAVEGQPLIDRANEIIAAVT